MSKGGHVYRPKPLGAWFGIFRGRVITEMCWFCPRGMIWMTDGSFDWYTWDDIPDLFCDLQAYRPAIGISFGRNTSWISFSNTEPSRRHRLRSRGRQ